MVTGGKREREEKEGGGWREWWGERGEGDEGEKVALILRGKKNVLRIFWATLKFLN